MPASEKALKWFVYYFQDNPEVRIWTNHATIPSELVEAGLLQKLDPPSDYWIVTKSGKAYLAITPPHNEEPADFLYPK
jgi:hypothetical protein